MPINTRKRKLNEKENGYEPSNNVDMVNQNNNHMKETISKRREKISSSSMDAKKKLSNKASKACEAQFDEDGSKVQMLVDGNKSNDSDEEIEEQEIEQDQSYNEDTNLRSNPASDMEESGTEQGEIDTDEESESEEECLTRKQEEKHQRKIERRNRRASMEEKLDTLTSSIKVMQDLMTQKGFFNEDKNKTDKKDKEKSAQRKVVNPEFLKRKGKRMLTGEENLMEDNS